MLPPRPERRLPPINDYERAVLRNVANFGWHCTSVYPRQGADATPTFSYSTGLYQTFGVSELILFGLPGRTAHALFGILVERLREGRPIALDQPCDDLIDGYPCAFVPVPRDRYDDYVYSALWFYAEVQFPLHQVVWPDSQGRFPWHERADRSFQEMQPVLVLCHGD